MNDGQYILPSELALVLGFVLLPAAVCAVAVQAYYLQRKNILASSPGRSALGLVATVLLGVAGAIGLFVIAPASWGSALGIRELRLFGQHWPVWPVGFIALAASSWLSTWWLLRSAKGAA